MISPSVKPISFPQQEDIVFHVHELLSHKDTARSSQVCHLWKKIANDPRIWINSNLERVFSKKLSIIDGHIWHAHINCPKFGLSVELSPTEKVTLKICAITIIKKFNVNLKVEKDQGFTLLTIPKGLTLNKLKKIAEAPIKGNSFYIADMSGVLKEFGEVITERVYQIVITNNVLVESKSKNTKIILDYYKKFEIEIPSLLEVAALCSLTYITSFPPIRLFPRGEFYTICSDKVPDRVTLLGDFQQERVDRIRNNKFVARLHLRTCIKDLLNKDVGASVMKTIALV